MAQLLVHLSLRHLLNSVLLVTQSRSCRAHICESVVLTKVRAIVLHVYMRRGLEVIQSGRGTLWLRLRP